jgi:hypothetical protein
MDDKNHSMTIFGEEIKPSAPCRKILQYAMNTTEFETDISLAKLAANSRKVSPNSLLGVSPDICQRALVD